MTQRFVVLAAFANEAVLDKNTGLVWEQAPDATTWNWDLATSYCANKSVGGTVGWRLPSMIELKSVQDPSLAPPFVPGSVFTNVQSATFWSASSGAAFPEAVAWSVFFGLGGVDDWTVGLVPKVTLRHAWCVRGGMHSS